MSELKQAIMQLAEELEQKISRDELDDIAVLLNRYAEMIKQYIALAENQDIRLLQQYNQRAIQLLSQKQIELKNSLYNLNHLKQYISV